MDSTDGRFDVISSICHLYNLGTVTEPPERVTGGWVNSTEKITTTKATFILRQYQPHSGNDLLRTTASIQAELNLIKYLHVKGLPVAPAIEPPSISLLDQRPSVFFPFIAGVKHVNHLHTPDKDLWQTVAVARFLGTMHRATRDYRDSSFQPVPNHAVVVPRLTCENEDFRQKYPHLLTRAQRLTDHRGPANFADVEISLPKGLLHMDLNPDNVLFDDEKCTIASVLDFDEVSHGPFILDVAITICHWCSIGARFDAHYGRQFLHEYEQARETLLTEHELQGLLVYCTLTALEQIEYFIRSDRDLEERKVMIEETLTPVEAMIELEATCGFLAAIGKAL